MGTDMPVLISIFLFGFCIPTMVVSQFNGLPRLDPNGKNVCEYVRNFASFGPGYPDPGHPNPGHRQRRRRHASSEEETIGVNRYPELWSSQVIRGASYQVKDANGSEQRPMMTDFFEYACCSGWEQKGKACTKALCDTECLYGKCTSPNTCTCKRGWKGSTCNEKCEPGDTSGDCRGSYICDPITHDCQCLPGYTGNRCDIPCPVGTYGPNCEGKCQCAEHMNENNTCDQYSGECPVIVDATQPHHSPQHKPNKTSSRNGVKMEGVPSADLIPTTHPPRMIVHEAISTMKIVFLSGVGIVAVFAAIGGLIFQKRKSQIVRKADSFFERKKAWGALVMTELNEVNERRRRARQAEVFNNVPESTYDNPPTPPSRRHTYLDSLMDTLDIQRSNYDGLRAPDGQDAIAQGTAQRNFTTLKSIADVKPINVPQEDESIYEVHECGAAACASATTSKARVDSIYTNESVFSVMNRSKMDNSLLTPVANAIVETSESEYDYPYTDMSDRACNYSSATEPRQNRRKRFGSRDRRMRKGSSDGQMYSVLVRPDIEAVSYQKQSYSHNLDTVAYASKIERTDEPVYEFQRIDSNTDLYSAHPNRVLIGNSLYDKPRGSSKRSNLDVPAPDDTYSDFIRDSSESTNQFALGYLTSVRKMPSIQVTPSDPTQFDYQPPEADHYQSYQCNSVIQRNLYRHQFQTVHNRPDKPTSISVTSSKLQRPNCLPLSKYHDYVNGKIISKPPLPQRYIPPLPSVRALREEGAASPSAASNGFPSPVSNASLSPSSSLPIPRSNGDYPSPDDLDSDNYLSLRFSERTPPMKPASNI